MYLTFNIAFDHKALSLNCLTKKNFNFSYYFPFHNYILEKY